MDTDTAMTPSLRSVFDRPITVLDLRDTHDVGGPGKTIIETFRALDASRFRMHVGVFAGSRVPAETPFVAAARAVGLPVHAISGRSQFDPRLAWRLSGLIRTLKVDIVHAHEVTSDLVTVLAAAIRPVATMTTLHGWIGNSRRQQLMGALDRRLARRFDRVVVVSQRMMRQLGRRGFRPGQVRLLHNAIVLERYEQRPRGALAELLGHELKQPVLGSIGRLSVEKGHADLLEAVALVKARGLQVSLVLVGDGPARADLEAMTRRLSLGDQVHFTGYLEHPQHLLNDFDLAVLPSHTEGLPNAALEALAMRVPLLATRVGGTPEVVTDGETGRLVEARSPRALAEGIEEFVAAPQEWSAMAARGRVTVEQRFDFKARTRALETMYVELHEGRR